MSNKVTSFSKQLYRVYSGPLDKNAHFDNLEDFEDYLAGITAESGNIYSGQIVSVGDPSSEIPLVFVIADGYVKMIRDKDTLYLLEIKTHQGNTFPFQNLSQYEYLLSYKNLPGIVIGVIFKNTPLGRKLPFA